MFKNKIRLFEIPSCGLLLCSPPCPVVQSQTSVPVVVSTMTLIGSARARPHQSPVKSAPRFPSGAETAPVKLLPFKCKKQLLY